jgi:hypothetical protein
MRREVEYRLNLQCAHWKATQKNEILPALQTRFEQALSQGVLLELETGAGDLVEEFLGAALADIA